MKIVHIQKERAHIDDQSYIMVSPKTMYLLTQEKSRNQLTLIELTKCPSHSFYRIKIDVMDSVEDDTIAYYEVIDGKFYDNICKKLKEVFE